MMHRTASSSQTKSWTRERRSGWAAFDHKEQKKRGLVPEIDKDPFPPMPSTFTTLHPCNNLVKDGNILSMRPFSSVLIPSVDFPTLTKNKNGENQVQDVSSRGQHSDKILEKNNHGLALKKLKEIHSWVDDSLIEDIIAATDHNIEKASALLKGMVSTSSFVCSEETQERKILELGSTIDEFPCDTNRDKSASPEKIANPTDLNSILDEDLSDVLVSGKEELSDDASDMKLIMGQLQSIPVQPEWEYDDVYLIHRKDALRMMRSASQHSRAATNAFLRGDHPSAQQHSTRARGEWLAAERLNAKAAKEILSIRNHTNDMWKLDLHGLHAAEAVQALQDHLRHIEIQVTVNHSVSPNRVKARDWIPGTLSLESLSCTNAVNSDKHWRRCKQRPTTLQVITGIGNHSRGQAALPTAVKSFLSENRYQFDEPRPGVVTVLPKFRPW